MIIGPIRRPPTARPPVVTTGHDDAGHPRNGHRDLGVTCAPTGGENGPTKGHGPGRGGRRSTPAACGRPEHRGRPAASCGREVRLLVAAQDTTGPLINGLLSQVPDIDPDETNEWVESFDGLLQERGGPRARYVLLSLLNRARERNVAIPTSLLTPYVNTIDVHEEPYFPGDEALERSFRRLMRWNAAVMVTRAQRPEISVGGHISSYASVATLYEVGFNHFFHGKDHAGGGDQVYFQGHAAPGIYARAFLEGRLSQESRGMLQLAAQQQLDNLIFVVNANLQRLDGPVRGNGKIIQELEAFFRGAGWNVIKVIWGREWDPLLNADKDRALVNLMNVTPDGDFQTYKANDGAFVRENFFGRDPRTKALVESMTDDQIWALKRGGHDYRKVYAAYASAVAHTGQPTVILAHTIKGYGLGSGFAGRNATHQMKKLKTDDLKLLRDFLHIPIEDDQLEDPYNAPYFHPGPDSPEIRYMIERRKALGGFLPERRTTHTPVTLPPDETYGVIAKGSGSQQVATTMAFVRLLKELIKDKEFGHRIVPIVPDEARTFGLDAIFPTAKIFSTLGQNYLAVDRELMLSYKESETGQILHTGINEAGSVAAFQAVGTSYATHGEPMLPVYIFYSMFGFQRTGDQFWACGDQMARGFVVGATAGRTTLTGEGLQHADGHSPLLAQTNPAVVHYDPAYAYEIRHIVRDGLQRMYGEGDPRDPNVMYYLTVYNEPMHQPAEPDDVDVEGIVRGIHRVATSEGDGPRAQILASGVGVPWGLEASQLLADDWGVRADVWSVTSWNELRRDGVAADEHAFLHPEEEPWTAYLTQKLQGAPGPFVATSDFNHLVVDQVRKWIPGEYETLGADGFGFSDTRAAARRFFHIDGPSTAVKVLQMLARRGEVSPDAPARAIERYQLHDVRAGSSGTAGGDA